MEYATLFLVVQVLLIVLVPLLGRRIAKHPSLGKWLSAVVVCYLVGIVIRNFNLLPLDEEISTTATEITIMFAIPLLLFSSGILSALKQMKVGLISFILCLMSAMIMTSVTAFLFKGDIEDTWRLAGMLTGIYTGGTPNMQAIGVALEAPEATIILVNAGDILLGGIYLILLTSVLHPLLKGILPDFVAEDVEVDGEIDLGHDDVNWRDSLIGIGLAIVVAGVSAGVTYLITGALSNVAVLILALTFFSVLMAFVPFVKARKGLFATGDYFLLMFCVALGLLADFKTIFIEGRELILFSAVALYGSIFLHFVLAKIFKIDRDTFLISSAAGVYGPIFIGQIATAINNRSVLFMGIVLGLLGYAVGNFLGIGLAELLFVLLAG